MAKDKETKGCKAAKKLLKKRKTQTKKLKKLVKEHCK